VPELYSNMAGLIQKIQAKRRKARKKAASSTSSSTSASPRAPTSPQEGAQEGSAVDPWAAVVTCYSRPDFAPQVPGTHLVSHPDQHKYNCFMPVPLSHLGTKRTTASYRRWQHWQLAHETS
jgi:hypothetical protein